MFNKYPEGYDLTIELMKDEVGNAVIDSASVPPSLLLLISS